MRYFASLSRFARAEVVCGTLTVLSGLIGLGYFAFIALPETHQAVSPANYAFLGIIVLILITFTVGLYRDVVLQTLGGLGLLIAGSVGMFWFMALGVFAYGPALLPSFLFSIATLILSWMRITAQQGSEPSA
ncbi:MAG TPA: hypothetical protein VF807_03160 [Ktedonobacterales bacterium]